MWHAESRCSYVVARMVCYEKILIVTSLVVTPRAAAEVESRNSCGRSHNTDRGRDAFIPTKIKDVYACIREISLISSRLSFLAFPAKYSLSRKNVADGTLNPLCISKCAYVS